MCVVFKQQTVYEIRISDWSSDVCSSELEEEIGLDAERGQVADAVLRGLGLQLAGGGDIGDEGGVDANRVLAAALVGAEIVPQLADRLHEGKAFDVEIGRASCRERGCEYV